MVVEVGFIGFAILPEGVTVMARTGTDQGGGVTPIYADCKDFDRYSGMVILEDES